MVNLKRGRSWILVLILGLFGCALPGGKDRQIPQIKLTVQNTLPIQRKGVPVVITLSELRTVAPDFSFDAYLVVPGQAVPGRPQSQIPSQADDINYDGQKDELVFLVDFEPQETKAFTILYDPENPVAVVLGFPKRTRAGIFPELKGIAALESDLAAYRLARNGSIQPYGKRTELLFSVESRFQGDLGYRTSISPDLRREFDKNSIAISQSAAVEVQKPYSRWLISNQENQQKYLIRKGEEKLNIYKAEELSINQLVYQVNTQSSADEAVMMPLTSEDDLIGCGGFALWDERDQQLIAPTDTIDYVRILSDGPVRSVVQRIIPNWQLKEGPVQFTSTVMVYAGNRWIEHHISARGLTSDYRIATGIRDLGGKPGKDAKGGWLWTWSEKNGTSPSTKLGMGVIFPVAEFDRFQDLTSRESGADVLTTLMRPNENGFLTYHAFSLWGDAVDALQTREGFDEYVQITATALNTPPVLQISPAESEQDKKGSEKAGEQTSE